MFICKNITKESTVNEVIRITKQTIGTNEVNTVNARELHQSLEIGKDFSSWIKAQIKSLGFESGADFMTTHPKRGVANGGHKTVTEYILTIETAKHIAMASRTAQGKAVRAYFIEVEREYLGRFARTSPHVIHGYRGQVRMLRNRIAALETQIHGLDPDCPPRPEASMLRNAVLDLVANLESEHHTTHQLITDLTRHQSATERTIAQIKRLHPTKRTPS